MNLFTHALLVWAQRREFHAVHAQLDRYSDRQLRDMGLTRGELTRVAYDEAERRVTRSDANVDAGAWRGVTLAPAS